MRRGGWTTSGLMGCLCVAMIGGCATMDDYRRVQAANRSLKAEKEAMAQDLFDCRNANESLRTRLTSLDREFEVKNELIANLRQENQLLEEMRKTAQAELERLAGQQTLGDITIAGPKLPEPLNQALKEFAAAHPDAVEYDPMRGTVKWKSDLLFPLGSDVVKQSSLEPLQGFTQILMSPAAEGFETLVVGHTDNRPIVRPETKANHPTNWHLACHRAISVAFALQKYGYAPTRMGVMGYGEHRPIADNSTESGAAKNRRVEIYLIPRGAIVEASASAATPGTGEAVAGVKLAP